MATLEEVLEIRKRRSILRPPTTLPHKEPGSGQLAVSETSSTMQFALRNNTSSFSVFAYVTGIDVSRQSVVMLRSDGQSVYYPQDPGADLQPLQADCAIALGQPGATRTITIPRMAGGRVWFVQDATLTFLLNRAGNNRAALVEPSMMNPSDPNYELSWSFCEFTFNEVEIFANISYVDFVNHPIALTLESTGGRVQHVAGMAADGLESVARKLAEQNGRDGAGWDRLVVRSSAGGSAGRLLRALSPNSGMHLISGLFDGYYQPYVDQVWQKYSSSDLTINTQFRWGIVKGRVGNDGRLTFGGVGSFGKPSSRDIFSSDSGSFAPPPGENQDQMRNMAARLAAAFNRGTLLINSEQPDGEVPQTYYRSSPICNHYARILHEVNLDGRGYAFPYDDVVPTNGADQAGTVSDGSPRLLTIILGGGGSACQKVKLHL